MKPGSCSGRLFFSAAVTTAWIVLAASQGNAYPIDGFERTGIRRLVYAQRVMDNIEKGSKLPRGALLSTDQVQLRMLSTPFSLTGTSDVVDPGLQKKINALFPNLDESYALTVLDITPGKTPRLALWQPTRRFALGSVGKLAIAAGLFTQLKNMFPDDPEKRRQLLKTRIVTAGPWIETDHHRVPVYDPASGRFNSRPIRQGDRFCLYEWADHMISASANAAASTLWKEAVLMHSFGKNYPPSPGAEKNFFATTPRSVLGEMAAKVVNQPLITAGITPREFHLGSFFTAAGKKMIPGEGDSNGSPMGLMKYLVAMEQGRICDAWSSREIKRLMYSTARRIRYASSPALVGSAVFFKSGSLYHCAPEPGYVCKKYMGNKDNFMNSVAIVENPDNRIYMVTLMTNVLKKNSAVDHQTLATRIDAVMKQE
ncbi:hypothetical protein [Desulfobacter sp.]|uniref:hypothetical protein n=1 Tax=Desulfobacter sp. TaxID=2294 RepID=UPI003D1360BC